MLLLDEDEIYRINVFDWKSGFPEVAKDGGFDAVVGTRPGAHSLARMSSNIYGTAIAKSSFG